MLKYVVFFSYHLLEKNADKGKKRSNNQTDPPGYGGNWNDKVANRNNGNHNTGQVVFQHKRLN